jgi:SAM-dependent methyltransferase
MSTTHVPGLEHYTSLRYDTKKRWCSYWHQLDETVAVSPASVLVIGVGSGVVPAYLRSLGIAVTTLDVVADLGPDLVADVRAIPAERGAFDVVVCCQVLEHIEYADIPAALSELARVARRRVVISLPRRGRYWELAVRIPPLPRIARSGVLPNRRRYGGDREHHWELGPRAVSPRRFAGLLAEHLTVERSYHVPEHPYHEFFVGTPRREVRTA